jgi:anti-anti-sigma regulatory factor
VLDAETAVDFRRAMMDLLTEQPPGVVIDVGDLDLADEVALTVLAAVARDSERWPGTRFAVGGAQAAFAESATRMGVTRNVTVCPDCDDAAVELNRMVSAPPRREVRLEPDRFAPGLAREAVHEFCQDLRVRRGADTAQLVVSELVTNAVVHAGTPIRLTLRLVLGDLDIAVRDDANGTVRITDDDPDAVFTGRGLRLVDALASRWGSFYPDEGKVVWATVRVRTGAQSNEVPSDLL